MNDRPKYRVKLEVTGGNPEYYPDPELQNGIDVDGIVILGYKESEPCEYVVEGVSVMDVAAMLSGKGSHSEIKKLLLQARAIADGLEKGFEISRAQKKREIYDDLYEALKNKAGE